MAEWTALRKPRDFRAVLEKAPRSGGTFTAVSAVVRGGSEVRVGISVSRRMGKAVARNYMRRVVRECLNKAPGLPEGADVVIVVRRRFGKGDFVQVCREIWRLVAAAVVGGERNP